MVDEVPPFVENAVKTVFFHYHFQKQGIVGLFLADIAVVPVGFGGEIVKVAGHIQFLSIFIHQGHIYGNAMGMLGGTEVGVYQEPGVGELFPEFELGLGRPVSIPDLQAIAAAQELFLGFLQFFGSSQP